MTINAGSTVIIPAASEVFTGCLDYFTQTTSSISARASKVTVEEIVDAEFVWHTLISPDDRTLIKAQTGRTSYQFFHRDSWQTTAMSGLPEYLSLVEDVKNRVIARFGDMKFIVWGKGKKFTLLSGVTLTETVVKPPKERKITKRNLMLVGSQWTFTQAVDVHLWIYNPEVDRLSRERDSYVTRRRAQTQDELDTIAAIKLRIDALPEQINILAAKIPKGCRVEITGKIAVSNTWGSKGESNGLMFPMKVIADGPIGLAEHFTQTQKSNNPMRRYDCDDLCFPYSQVEAAMEAVEGTIPEDIKWTLRDSKTGEYFGGWLIERDNYRQNRTTDTPKLSGTFSGAKKYKTLSAVKASIMDFTGYHNGIDIEGYVGDWIGRGNKKMDLPENWEAVGVDKTTNQIKRTEDVQIWYGNLMRLRELTVRFGGAVRGAFKKAEGKDYKAIVAFQLDGRDFDAEDPAIIREFNLITESVEASGANKPLRELSELSMAYAVESETDATMIMLAYQGAAKCRAFDITTMEEIIAGETL